MSCLLLGQNDGLSWGGWGSLRGYGFICLVILFLLVLCTQFKTNGN